MKSNTKISGRLSRPAIYFHKSRFFPFEMRLFISLRLAIPRSCAYMVLVFRSATDNVMDLKVELGPTPMSPLGIVPEINENQS